MINPFPNNHIYTTLLKVLQPYNIPRNKNINRFTITVMSYRPTDIHFLYSTVLETNRYYDFHTVVSSLNKVTITITIL